MTTGPRMLVSLLDREIEAKVNEAIEAELAKGKKPGDMGRRDFVAMTAGMREGLSPEAFRKLGELGLEIVVQAVFGEMLAERLWSDGRGYGVTDADLVALAAGIGFEPAHEAPHWMELFRDDIASCNLDRLNATYKSAERFRGILLGEPVDALLGEVAIKKAMKGDPLARAFLSGRPEVVA